MKNLTKLSAIALAGSVMMTSAKAVEIEVHMCITGGGVFIGSISD